MATVPLSLKDIYNLANKTLLCYGCDEETSNILSDLVMRAEGGGAAPPQARGWTHVAPWLSLSVHLFMLFLHKWCAGRND